MAFLEDVVDSITSDITTIGLATGATAGDEVTGDGYAPQTPTYAGAIAGSADLTAVLNFSGPPSTLVSHLIFRNASGVWVIRAATAAVAFDASGQLNLTSAPVTAAFAS